jgi:uncharacterized protein
MRSAVVLIVLVLAAAAAVARPPAQPDAGFQLGDRLKQAPAAKAKPAPTSFREINWDELIAPGWDPRAIVRELQFGVMSDADPRAREAMNKLREAWNKAPANPQLAGAAVRIPGFVVPLDAPGKAQREFLLVPYFGACIHTPPPPANQIIHVSSRKPLKDIGEMIAVWVNGTLAIESSETAMGAAGYRMSLEKIEPYEEPPGSR